MKRELRIIPGLLLLAVFLSYHCTTIASEDRVDLWPHIEPFQTGHLKVSEIHSIYYELCGNPRGKSVFVLHGGPGGMCYPYMRRFFNPEKFLIVLHDQRGCGKSTPFAELRENTTQHLVEDIEKLRHHLDLDNIILFGGSWGTTLALAYGETYPDHVSGMVLRGVFTATKEEMDHYYRGGVSTFFPETYDKLKAILPDQDMTLSPQTLFELIQKGDWEQREKYSTAWWNYEGKISRIEAIDEDAEKLWAQSDTLKYLIFDLALIENYYMANKCFLEEGQLLTNTDKIRKIPITIVNGRYDMICPPINAYRLHNMLPKSRLIVAEMAGHSMSQKPIAKALLKAMVAFE